LLFIIIVDNSCVKPDMVCDEGTEPYLDTIFVSYFAPAKTGSYWIYVDSLGNTDSEYVNAYRSMYGGPYKNCYNPDNLVSYGYPGQEIDYTLKSSFYKDSTQNTLQYLSFNQNLIHYHAPNGFGLNTPLLSMQSLTSTSPQVCEGNDTFYYGYSDSILKKVSVKDANGKIYTNALSMGNKLYYVQGIGLVKNLDGYIPKNGLEYPDTWVLKRYKIVK